MTTYSKTQASQRALELCSTCKKDVHRNQHPQDQVYRENYADPATSFLQDPMATVGHGGQEEEVIHFTSAAKHFLHGCFFGAGHKGTCSTD